MLQRSTPLALPKEQWDMMLFKSLVLLAYLEVARCWKSTVPVCQSLLQAAKFAAALSSGLSAKPFSCVMPRSQTVAVPRIHL
eukprot:625613-Amphidinium_carterae.1